MTMDFSFQISIEQEARPGYGEDAVCCSVIRDGRNVYGLTACLDGCGGSGAARYESMENWSGARLGSHRAGIALLQWFENGDFNAPLKSALDTAMQSFYRQLKENGRTSGLKSGMIRPLPTTLSAVLTQTEREGVRLTYFWVGDSRGYLLSPNGLIQITRDDVNGDTGDDYLPDDGILNNVISATGEYCIHVEVVHMDRPCIAIVATDGSFNYFGAPMLFEQMLYDTMLAAHSPQEWADLITETVRPIAGDDFSLAMIAYGFDDFPSIQRVFYKRYKTFVEKFGLPAARFLEEKDGNGLRALWQAYKQYYFGGNR